MLSRTTRRLAVVVFSFVLASASYAAPDGRRDSGDWLIRSINRIVHQIKKIISAPLPLDETTPVPPHP